MIQMKPSAYVDTRVAKSATNCRGVYSSMSRISNVHEELRRGRRIKGLGRLTSGLP